MGIMRKQSKSDNTLRQPISARYAPWVLDRGLAREKPRRNETDTRSSRTLNAAALIIR
jgi:hypothetical protein